MQGRSVVRKVEDELFQQGRVLTLDEGRVNRDIDRGPGVRTLSNLDQVELRCLRSRAQRAYDTYLNQKSVL